MERAVLVLEMPSNCKNCKLSRMEEEMLTCVLSRNPVGEGINKHENCPLQALPVREMNPELKESDYSLGWAAYHDTIVNSIFASLYIRDYRKAFDNAIRKGLKNLEDYMYMYSDMGVDYFKHSCTRAYRGFTYLNFATRTKMKIIKRWRSTKGF